MPLLMCPNDNAAMQTVNRGGVEFDMCPTCRGVWLDRGELEKLMAGATNSAEAPSPYQPPSRSSPWNESGRHDDHDRKEYREKGKRRGGIFDIFD